jgi:SH3-like domain-containing protein
MAFSPTLPNPLCFGQGEAKRGDAQALDEGLSTAAGQPARGDQAGRARMYRFLTALVMTAALLAPPLAAQDAEGPAPSAETEAPASARSAEKQCQPDVGCVTNLPLPRFVSLKGSQGNARRGPGLTHRIDWVFTRAGMPLRITAEFENWRRVEDFEGAGGWVHYSLLSGVRTVLVTLDMAELRDRPAADATVIAQAELGVLGRLLACNPDWCRVALDGQRGWVRKSAIWGVRADETFE